MSICVLTEDGEKILEPNGEGDISQLLINNGVFVRRQCGGRGTCKKCSLLVNGREVLACQTPVSDGITVDCRKRESYSILTEGESVSTALLPITGDKKCCCAAVDIGTTTVVVRLYTMPEFELVGTSSELNAQSAYGADVISRMDYANNGGLHEMNRIIRAQVDSMLLSFGREIEKTVVTGNTAMLHFYCGLSTSKMAAVPFQPESLFGLWQDNVYLPHCVSAFVGADTVCAVSASGMLEDECSLLADLGTNGEIVYLQNGELRCCSVAAGPAFEGAGISQGVTACEGAINKVYTVNSSVYYTTIGDTPSVGVCASGLIDAIACMLELGEIDETGYLDAPFQIGDSGIYITPGDIRAVQLAKSAVRAGIDMLAGDCSKISTLYLAGGFGSGINAVSCAKIGLIPWAAVNKIKCISNAALSGAAMMIKNKHVMEQSIKIAQSAHTVCLSGNPEFSEKYIENMLFTS